MPASPDTLIRRGLVGDAAALATFAARTFAEAFGGDTDADDLRAHLAATYRPDLQARELADPTVITWLAVQDARIVAFAQVRRAATAPACVVVPDAVEVQRFYTDRSVRGSGLALRLMEHALDAARELGGQHAWLGVWEHNARAIAFYRKAGFAEIGSTYYMVGSDRQTDRVFLASLSPCGSAAAHSQIPLSQGPSMKKYKVVQWATGGMGKNCLRAVIDHPAMELVGVYVYGADKEGKDAGTIARREPIGVLATRSVDEILALDADVVIHAARLAPPYGSHDADILRLLAAGKNVISINGYSHPQYWGGERLAALEAACHKGGSSLIGAGLNPGYAGEQLAVVATGVCTEVDHVEVVESVDCRAVRSPDYVFKILGFGAEPGAVDPNDPAWGPSSSLNGMYAEVLATMAERLGMPLDRVDTEHRVFAASMDLQIGAGTIPKGCVSHFNWRWRGIVQGTPRLTMSIHWYMETTHLDDPQPPLWRIHVQGQPGVRISLDMEKRAGDTTPTSAEQIAVAGTVINAIPVVCAAPPGIVTRPLATPFQFGLAGPAIA